MTILRSLQLSDSEYMMEFVDDEEIAQSFKFTRFPFSIDGFKSFIEDSWGNKFNIHYAISNNQNDYLGTISLKNINYVDRTAEYAIVLRKKYWGNNYAYDATILILDYAFKVLNLNKVYLNVLSSNFRAQKFYDKFGFVPEGIFKKHVFVNNKLVDLKWYCIFKENYSRREIK